MTRTGHRSGPTFLASPTMKHHGSLSPTRKRRSRLSGFSPLAPTASTTYWTASTRWTASRGGTVGRGDGERRPHHRLFARVFTPDEHRTGPPASHRPDHGV